MLGCDRLPTLPETIGNLSRLRHLRASVNTLREIPPSVLVSTLITIDCRGNEIEVLPDVIGRCTALTSLQLQKNALVALPESIGKLTSLQVLSVVDSQTELMTHRDCLWLRF